MTKSKAKKNRPADDFLRKTEEAMRRVKRVVEAENARFGLPLVVRKSR